MHDYDAPGLWNRTIWDIAGDRLLKHQLNTTDHGREKVG